MNTAVSLHPDWVMLGVSRQDGSVWLIASNELSSGELSSEIDYDDVWDTWAQPLRRITTSVQYRVTAELRTYVLITAPNYTAAFDVLLRQWRPDSPRL
jgi:hypothetical protein